MFRRVLALFALVGLLAACSSAPSQAPAPGSGATDAFPARVDHAFGTTEIPTRPQRVVTLGVTDADPVLALGVTPVGTSSYPFFHGTGGLGPWARGMVRGEAPQVLTDAEPNLEKIASLRPDLIVAVTTGIEQAEYDQLSAIAPVVARPAGTIPYGVPRSDQTRSVAVALGERERGEQLVRAADEAFTTAVAENPQFRGKVGPTVLPFDGKYGAFTDVDSRGRFMTGLGFTQPARIAERDDGRSFYVEVAAEQAGLLDGDVLVMLADGEPARRQIEADPVLARVPVVARGDMIVPDTDTRGAITYNSVLSVPYALERLVPQLVQRLGG